MENTSDEYSGAGKAITGIKSEREGWNGEGRRENVRSVGSML